MLKQIYLETYKKFSLINFMWEEQAHYIHKFVLSPTQNDPKDKFLCQHDAGRLCNSSGMEGVSGTVR